MKKISKLQEEQIKQLLIENYSIKDISNTIGVCREVIRRRARRLGIKPFKGKSKVYTLKDAPNELKQLIIGSLLGDGSFVKGSSNSSSYCMSIAHKTEQYNYLEYKFNILNNYGLVNNIHTHTYNDCRFINPSYTECRIRTRNNPLFTYIRNNAYVDNKKSINLDIIEDMDALGLAIWYMDDGYVTKSSCIFSTCSFATSLQQRLADFLLGRFGLHFTVGNNDNSLYLISTDFNKFKEIVSPYIIPSMQYKLIPYSSRVLNKSGELLEHPIEDNQQPS